MVLIRCCVRSQIRLWHPVGRSLEGAGRQSPLTPLNELLAAANFLCIPEDADDDGTQTRSPR